jgi:SAM-dependent methyltransferase
MTKTLSNTLIKPYPLNHVGTYLRVTKEFLPNWVDFDKLLIDVRSNNESIDSAITDDGQAKDALKQACYRIGSASYTPEWLDQKTQDHLEVIDNVAEGVTVSNQQLSFQVLPHAIEHFETKTTPYTILDVGPGVGSTIIPVIEGLDLLSKQGFIPNDYHERLRVVLLDVMPKSLEYTKKRLQKRLQRKDELPRKTIHKVTTIQSNFADLDTHPKMQKHRGTIDAIISGGAIMHNTDKDPFFQTMYDSLSSDGQLSIWDWSAGYCWAAPNLRLDTLNGYNLDDNIYQITPADVAPIHDNLIFGWMGEHGLFA